MISPYKGKFRVTQQYKGSAHDGLDLVGVDSKNIYSTIDGVVEYAGWENATNHKQGFGQYVRIKKSGSVDRYYFGHLSQISVEKGQSVKVGTLLGKEGSTGNSTGSHCHYCARGNASKSAVRDIPSISGIPNAIGTYSDSSEKTAGTAYFAKYIGTTVSIVNALKSIGAESSFAYRSKIAKANGISGYIGTASQNTKMLSLLKQGKLIKP